MSGTRARKHTAKPNRHLLIFTLYRSFNGVYSFISFFFIVWDFWHPFLLQNQEVILLYFFRALRSVFVSRSYSSWNLFYFGIKAFTYMMKLGTHFWSTSPSFFDSSLICLPSCISNHSFISASCSPSASSGNSPRPDLWPTLLYTSHSPVEQSYPQLYIYNLVFLHFLLQTP